MIEEILVLGFLGIVLSLGLEIASRRFEREGGGERIGAVEDTLPGLDCGACGYAGCSQYAKEVVADPSKLGACVQISEEGREEIAEILGVETVEEA